MDDTPAHRPGPVSKDKLAYRIKEAHRGLEPPHYLCPACYQKREKAILQPHEWSMGNPTLECPVCELKIDRAHYTTIRPE